jgi:hypothetical protein
MSILTRRTFLGAAAGAMALPSLVRAAPAKKKLVMLAGRPSHGPGAHEFNAGVLLLAKCLGKVEQVEVSVHKNGWPESEKAFEGADGIFLFADGGGGHPFIQGPTALLGDLMRAGRADVRTTASKCRPTRVGRSSRRDRWSLRAHVLVQPDVVAGLQGVPGARGHARRQAIRGPRRVVLLHAPSGDEGVTSILEREAERRRA